MRFRFVYFLILPAFFAIAAALHYPGFHSPMIYDSVGFIQEYEYVFASGDLLAVLGIVPARPLLMTSFYANYLITGMDPYGFRLFNAFVLACASAALVLLSVLVLELPGARVPGTRREKRFIGLFLGFVFLVHPLQGLTVLYIWQREAIMACFFSFSALAVYVAGRSGKGIPALTAYIATGCLFFAGILSKENVITLPIVLLLAEIVLLRGTPHPDSVPSTSHLDAYAGYTFATEFRQVMKRASIIAMIIGVPLLVALLLVHTFHGPEATHSQGLVKRLMEYYQTAGIGPIDVVLTACRMLFWYLFTVVAPFLSGVELVAPCVVSRSLWSPPSTVAAVAGVATLVAVAFAFRRRHPVPSFGIWFFLITLAPESLLIPQYLFCGYRAILPMAGVLLVLAAVVLGLISGSSRSMSRIAIASMLAAAILGLSVMTVMQARRWKPLLVWQNAYDRMPSFTDNVEITPYLDILGSYGLELKHAGDYVRAVEVLDRLIAIDSPANSFKKTPRAR